MSHFTDESWFDYVRNLLPPDQIYAMKTHLNEGCEDCTELHSLWKRVLDTVNHESRYAPDPSDVRVVTGAFNLQRRSAVPRTRVMAAVLFDSLRDPAPAGFR